MMCQFNFVFIALVWICVTDSTLITIRKRYGGFNATAAPSNVNTTIVSSAMLRLAPLPTTSIPSIPYVVKTKSWVPTCPSTMPIICPCQALNSSTTPTNQPIKISEFPSTKVVPRTYLRGGFHYTEKSTKKNLRGSSN
jgi:hypothetical protein